MRSALVRFVTESNAIEGIKREPTKEEVDAHLLFLALHPTVESLENLVSAVQPDAQLRRRRGMDVRVGIYLPPPGGDQIERDLEAMLAATHRTAYERHRAYESLHRNGRSGRALWLHDMGGLSGARLGFLHTWYYQSLEADT